MNSSLLVISLTLVVFAIIVIGLRLLRKERVDVREIRRQQLGFLPIETPAEELVNRIRALQYYKREKMHIIRVSQKKTLDGDLYLYDAYLDSDTYLEDRLIVVSPLLQLPYFALFQLPKLEEKWGKKMNNFADNVIGWTFNFTGMQRVHLTAFPEFDRKFILLAENKEQVEKFFNAERMQMFVSLGANIAIDAFGDSLQITTYGKNNSGNLDLEIAAATKLMQILRSQG
jgi:hypothetical protein